MTFFFINLSLIKLRWDLPETPRAFRVPLYQVTSWPASCPARSSPRIFPVRHPVRCRVRIAIGIFAFEVRLKKHPDTTG